MFFHPETDGQSQIANQEMEKHLRTFVNYQQDDWVDKLWQNLRQTTTIFCQPDSLRFLLQEAYIYI